MKVFKHKKLGGLRVSRKALRHYALYRRHSLIKHKCDLASLEAFHRYESTGELPDGTTEQDYLKNNGFANGKWVLKVISTEIEKDLAEGLVCKAEFYDDPSGWFWKKYLENKPVTKLFIY